MKLGFVLYHKCLILVVDGLWKLGRDGMMRGLVFEH